MLGAVSKGLIPCITDGGMRGLADELNPNGFNETCNWHSFQRLGLRTREDCLKLFDEEDKTTQKDKLDAIMKFCDKAKKDMSAKDMRKKNIPSTHARGINSYFDGLELTNDDRLRICKFARPNGWKAQFDDDSAELPDSEKNIKKDLIASRKSLPKIKVMIGQFCALINRIILRFKNF